MNALNRVEASWNGRAGMLSELLVPATDRATFFGDAVYEVVRIYNHKMWLFSDHIARLATSMARLRIVTDLTKIASDITEKVRESGIQDGYVYVQVSRGSAPRNHSFPGPGTEPNILIFCQTLFEDPYGTYRKLGISAITFEDIRWKWRDIKSVNLLANCIAKQSADEQGCQEAIFVESDGTITEATSNNVFVVRGDEMFTAPADTRILSGITRKFVILQAGYLGFKVKFDPIRVHELYSADEVFVTGSLSEVLAVTKIDGRAIGNGLIGAKARSLKSAFDRAIERPVTG